MRYLFLIASLVASVALPISPTSFFRTCRFRAPAQKILSIEYGNHAYGFFSTSHFTQAGRDLSLRFLPPGYHTPLQFFARTQNARLPLSGCHVAPPSDLTAALTPRVKLTGTFSTPYVLTNGYVGTKGNQGTGFIYVLNRSGEVVWMYLPKASEPSWDNRTRTLITKPVGNGRYGILRPFNRSYFELVDFEGHLLASVDPQHATSPFVIHHDFVLASDNRLLALSQIVERFRKPWHFWKRKESFLGTRLIQIDLKSGEPKPLWSCFSMGNPFLDPDWRFTALDSGDFWGTFQEPHAANNFSHGNSLQWVKGQGYLISLRNLNKLVFVDEATRTVKWSVGPSPKDTFSTQGTPAYFYRQHHATLLSNGHILLFDNHTHSSRVIELSLDPETHRAVLAREFKPSPPLFTPRHGSAFILPNGNVLTFFPNTRHDYQGPDHVIEFDGRTQKAVADLEVKLGIAAFRAIPLAAIGDETFLGF